MHLLFTLGYYSTPTKAFFNCARVSEGFWRFEIVPQMLYRGQIWTVWWPVKWDDVIVCEKITTYSGNTWPGNNSLVKANACLVYDTLVIQVNVVN